MPARTGRARAGVRPSPAGGRRGLIAALSALVALAAACGSSGPGGPPPTNASATAEPLPTVVRAADFAGPVDNPWFPLTPGTTLTYTGTKDGKAARDVFTVTRETENVDGVTCVVVQDRLYLDGILAERTTDWYAQDRNGAVWYFGEATATLAGNGDVTSTDGSWRSGRDGALPGVYMPGRPAVGQIFRQEYYRGHAEDHFQVLSLAAAVRVPATSTTTALRTKEWTPLEADTVDEKYYVQGIGVVKELAVRGGPESLDLESVTRS